MLHPRERARKREGESGIETNRDSSCAVFELPLSVSQFIESIFFSCVLFRFILFSSLLNAFVLRFPTVSICKMIYELGKRCVAIAVAAATNQPWCQASMEFRVCGISFSKEKLK